MHSNSIGKSKVCLLVIPLLLLFAVAGCATLFSGTTEKLNFTSDIDGVRIYIDGRLVGKTPLEVKLEKNLGAKGPTLKAEKEDFETQEFKLQKKFDNVAIWNLTSVFSWGTDLISGALWEYEPKKYHIELVPQKQAAQSRKFYRKRLLYRYVLFSHGNILRDLSRGHGSYLDSLAAVLIDDIRQRGDFLTLLRHRKRVFLESDSGIDFIDKLNEMLASHPAMHRFMV